MSQMLTPLQRRLAPYPANGRYRVSTPNGLTICGFPFEYLDEIPADCSLRQMPLRLSAMVEQRQLEFIRDDEEAAGGGIE